MFEHSAHMSLSGSSGLDDELRIRLHKIQKKKQKNKWGSFFGQIENIKRALFGKYIVLWRYDKKF